MRGVSILLTVVAATGLACASAGNRGAARDTCLLTRSDSTFAGTTSLYRACAVDRPARFLSYGPRPDFRPESSTPACYFADVEFVVDSTGRPEVSTARVNRSNHAKFADTVLATLKGWRFEPAMRDGKTVRQIVASHETVATGTVVVPDAAVPPSRPPTSGRRAETTFTERAPTC